MLVELKVRKVGNSLGVVIPKEALSRLCANEGDTLILSEAPDGAFRVRKDDAEFARQMAIAESVAVRYRNTLRELAK